MSKKEDNGGYLEGLIEDHKKAMILTGNLSDFQLTNLKYWPYLIWGNDLDTVKIEYDFDFKEDSTPKHSAVSEGWIKFVLNFKKGKVSLDSLKDRQKLESHLLLLRQWVKRLFWQETAVFFVVNGQEIKLKELNNQRYEKKE